MSKRYIDADDAIYELDRVFSVDDFKKIIRAISRTPTVDAVEVVRCKDCEFYTAEDKWCRRLGLCGAFDGEGFCSHGERRSDG